MVYAIIIKATIKLYESPLILIFLKFPSENTNNRIPSEIMITDNLLFNSRFSPKTKGVNNKSINEGNPRAMGYPKDKPE